MVKDEAECDRKGSHEAEEADITVISGRHGRQRYGIGYEMKKN